MKGWIDIRGYLLQLKWSVRRILDTFTLGGWTMSTIQALENEIGSLKEEFEKFERGNKSAGTRARKILQNIKRISQEIRVTIQSVKKTDDTEA